MNEVALSAHKNMAQAVVDLYVQRPRVAILMSGMGSNAHAILSSPDVRDLFDVTAIVTDNSSSNAAALAEEHGVKLLDNHQERFNSIKERHEYFTGLGELLGSLQIQGAFYAGYMKIVTSQFLERFPGINVHPADLSIIGSDGLAKYRGMSAMSAMRSDLGYVRSSAHVVDEPVDSGSVLGLSESIKPNTKLSDTEVHELLKTKEHPLYVEVLRLLGSGSLSLSTIPFIMSRDT